MTATIIEKKIRYRTREHWFTYHLIINGIEVSTGIELVYQRAVTWLDWTLAQVLRRLCPPAPVVVIEEVTQWPGGIKVTSGAVELFVPDRGEPEIGAFGTVLPLHVVLRDLPALTAVVSHPQVQSQIANRTRW